MIGFGEIQRNLIRSDAIGWLPRRWWTCRAVVRLAGCHIVGGLADAIGWLPRSWFADAIGWLLLNGWTC